MAKQPTINPEHAATFPHWCATVAGAANIHPATRGRWLLRLPEWAELAYTRYRTQLLALCLDLIIIDPTFAAAICEAVNSTADSNDDTMSGA